MKMKSIEVIDQVNYQKIRNSKIQDITEALLFSYSINPYDKTISWYIGNGCERNNLLATKAWVRNQLEGFTNQEINSSLMDDLNYSFSEVLYQMEEKRREIGN